MKILNYSIKLLRRYSSSSSSSTKPNYKKSNSESEIKWTDQQLQVLDAVSDGKSVFISGSGGTGKTILVNRIIKRLNSIYGTSKVFATASTGVAACAINGQTLHSFAGIGLGKGDPNILLNKVFKDKRAHKRWSKVDALIVDECSMIDAHFLDNLHFIAQKIKSLDKPWGGIQLIVSGDFFQLPPVELNSKGFAFEAKCWNSSFHLQIELTEIFRQSDPQLIKLLQGIRRGESDPDDLRLLEEHCTDEEPDPSMVRIYPRKEDVESINREHLTDLSGRKFVYHAVDSGDDSCKSQLKSGIASDEIELRVGARVMLNKNIKPWRKLVNGATGTVIGFSAAGKKCRHELVPSVKFDGCRGVVDIYPEKWDVIDGDKKATREQIPLILAWALSIHKCQGMSLERVHTDLSRAFGYGMVYVALSRVKNLDGLYLSGFDPSKIMAHPKVLNFYESLRCGHSQ